MSACIKYIDKLSLDRFLVGPEGTVYSPSIDPKEKKSLTIKHITNAPENEALGERKTLG